MDWARDKGFGVLVAVASIGINRACDFADPETGLTKSRVCPTFLWWNRRSQFVSGGIEE
jgi:hypothetical protein